MLCQCSGRHLSLKSIKYLPISISWHMALWQKLTGVYLVDGLHLLTGIESSLNLYFSLENNIQTVLNSTAGWAPLLLAPIAPSRSFKLPVSGCLIPFDTEVIA